HQQLALRQVQRLAVDAHVIMADAVVGVEHLAGGVRDPALAEHPRHFPAAAVAEVGDQPHKLHRPALRARTTLKPSRAAISAISPKRSPSACSYGRWRLATSHRVPPGTSAPAAAAMKARPMSGRAVRPWPWNGGLLTMTS